MTSSNFGGGCEFGTIERLSDDELVSRLMKLNAKKHALDAELLLHLSELDRRWLYREHACSSLFVYCVRRLGYSEDVAFKRVAAARLVRQYPMVLELLHDGRLHLSALLLLKPLLTPDNHREMLHLACGKSKREIERLLASIYPQADVPTSIRKLPERKFVDHTPALESSAVLPGSEARQSHESAVAVTAKSISTSGAVVSAPVGGVMLAAPSNRTPSANAALVAPSNRTPSANAESAAPLGSESCGSESCGSESCGSEPRTPNASGKPYSGPRTSISPLSARSYRVVFTASDAFKEKLDRAAALLSHAIRPGNVPALLERALDLLIAREERRRFGGVARATVNVARDPDQVQRTANPIVEDPDPVLKQESCRTDPQSLADIAEAVDIATCRGVYLRAGNGAARSDVTAETPAEVAAAMSTGFAVESPRDLVQNNPPPSTNAKRRRDFPRDVRRIAWQRDIGQCSYVDEAGNRCGETCFLQFDHRRPFALGGDDRLTNCRVYCAAHNALAAAKAFGRQRIDRRCRVVR